MSVPVEDASATVNIHPSDSQLSLEDSAESKQVWSWATFKQEQVSLWKLAFPVTMATLSYWAMGLVDLMFVGNELKKKERSTCFTLCPIGHLKKSDEGSESDFLAAVALSNVWIGFLVHWLVGFATVLVLSSCLSLSLYGIFLSCSS